MRTISVFVFLVIAAGCGGPDGDTWLIRTTEGEITVADAGVAWNELDPRARQRFIESENTMGEFITTLSRKTMVISEISNESYLYSNQTQALRAAWVRNSVFAAYRDSMASSIVTGLTETDIANYRALFGKIVWYTTPDGTGRGPQRLPDLNWELAFAFDTMSPGEAYQVVDGVYILDSVTVAPDSLIQDMLADTAGVNAFARSSLTEGRAADHLDSLRTVMMISLEIDSSVVEMYCSSRSSLADSTQVAAWENGLLTVADLDGTIALLGMGTPVAGYSPQWVTHTLSNQAGLAFVERLFSERFAEAYEEILHEGERFAMEKAGDMLFTESVLSRVDLTDQMVLEAYETMDSIPIFPETRICETVMIPASSTDEVLAMLEGTDDPRTLGFPGYPSYTAEGEEFVSRPLTAAEIHPDMGTILFMLEEDNTEWQRPMEISERVFIVFRLQSVIPPSQATFEQMEGTIRRNLLAHLEEQTTMDWLRELEEAHGLEINSGILGDLPSDPSLWSEL